MDDKADLPSEKEGKEAKPEPETSEAIQRESGEVEHRVVQLAARDTDRSPQDEQSLASIKAEKAVSFYSDIIYTITNLRYPEPEARVMWVNMLSHKWTMSQKLGRNVGISVAALDFFRNVLGILDDVKIVAKSQYVETNALALTDGLTGVFNHRAFYDMFRKELQRAEEQHYPLVLMMLDLDHFKIYNDRNGHIAGDVALREFAKAVRNSIKNTDIIARYGGEEFAVILRSVGREEVPKVAERIRKTVEEVDFPNESVMPSGNLTVSIGVAVYPDDAKDRSALITAADNALYRAKSLGRNRISLAMVC